MKTIDVLETLSKIASNYNKDGIIESIIRNSHMNNVGTDICCTPEEAEAIVVDFINYVARCCGVDYGLYACDIE